MKYIINDISKIKKEYGLPCYVFDEKAFCENYRHLETALRSSYGNYQIAYSYKTNYAPKLCSIVKNMGGYAEVVSDMEYEIAKAVGYSSSKIIYNGPFKGAKLEEHLLENGILNIDNLEEIDRVVAFANTQKREFKVGVRVNINVGQNFISRFGIDADSDDLQIAVDKLHKCKYTRLVGLHCHIGQSRSLEAWKKRTETMLVLADKYIEEIPEYLDLGSGMFGDMTTEMLEQFAVVVPTYEEYAQVTSEIVKMHYLDVPEKNKPILFTEPGATVDNRYIDLIAEVDSIKKIKGKAIAVLNCSIHNLGDVCMSVKLPLKIIPNSSDRKEYQDMDLVGYTCLERDVPYKNFSGVIGKGDYLVFGNIGGYSNVDKPPFILPQCAMIGIGNNGTYVIKRKETTEDVLSTYVLG